MQPTSLLEFDLEGIHLQVGGFSELAHDALKAIDPDRPFLTPHVKRQHFKETRLRFVEGVGEHHFAECRVIQLLQQLGDYLQGAPATLIPEPVILIRIAGTLLHPAPRQVIGGCGGTGPQVGRARLSQDGRTVKVVYRCGNWPSMPRHLDHIICDMTNQPRTTRRVLATHAD